MSDKNVSKLEEIHLCFREINKEQYTWLQDLGFKSRSGTNPKTLKQYVCLVVSDYIRMAEVLKTSPVGVENIQLSINLSSELNWGNYVLPAESIEFAHKHKIPIKISYMTPP